MNRPVLMKQIKGLELGDLICCEWYDASTGRSSAGNIDVPVKSYGIYLGVLGERNKHIILCQNSFKYTNGIYDIDYTAIPLSWTLNLTILVASCVHHDVAHALLLSFQRGRRRTLKRRILNHGT